MPRNASHLDWGSVAAVKNIGGCWQRRNTCRVLCRGASWAYCVDVESSALKAAGLRRLQERLGTLERQQQQQEQPPALAQAGAGEGASKSGASAEPVVVVGSGPAGLFAALQLAEAGIKVSLVLQAC